MPFILLFSTIVLDGNKYGEERNILTLLILIINEVGGSVSELLRDYQNGYNLDTSVC